MLRQRFIPRRQEGFRHELGANALCNTLCAYLDDAELFVGFSLTVHLPLIDQLLPLYGSSNR